MKQRIGFVFVVAGALISAGCSGGGNSSNAAVVPVTGATLAPAAVRRVMDISFAGTTALSRSRRTQSLTGTAVTVTYNGNAVATGTLDASGHATLTFSAEVPRGATVVVTAGTVTATIVLAQSDDGTAAQVTVNSDGTLTVSTTAEHPGASPAPSPSPGTSASPAPGSESSTSQEDHNGNPTVISTTMTMLPANLPISIVANCGTVTIAPVSGALPNVLIEMKSSDSEAVANFRFEGALTVPVSFPVTTGSQRIHIRIIGATGNILLDIQGPVTASTLPSTGTPCPLVPSASPTASAAPEASGSPESGHDHSPTPSTSPTAHP